MSQFGNAFAAARKAGKSNFSFGGKSYNTRTKDEENARSQVRPPARPASFDDRYGSGPMASDALKAKATTPAPASFDERFGNGPMASDYKGPSVGQNAGVRKADPEDAVAWHEARRDQ